MPAASSPKKSGRTKVKPSKDLPTLPRLESTYTQIIVRAMRSARGEKTFTQRVAGFTRELKAMVPVTRQKWRGLSLLGKALTLIITFGLGAGSAVLALQWSASQDPAVLRARLSEKIEAKDWTAAKKLLHALASTSEGLSDSDRVYFVTPIQNALNKEQQKLEARLEKAVATKAWNEALAILEEAERLDAKPEWTVWQTAEVLRSAGRSGDAISAYERYFQVFPTSDRADDALFWQAEGLKNAGDPAGARRALERLLNDYPGSDFKSSAKRWLQELEAP